MMEHHEEIISRRLQEQRISVDTEALWSAIRHQIPTGQTTNKAKHVHWVALSMLLLFLLGAAFIWLSRDGIPADLPMEHSPLDQPPWNEIPALQQSEESSQQNSSLTPSSRKVDGADQATAQAAPTSRLDDQKISFHDNPEKMIGMTTSSSIAQPAKNSTEVEIMRPVPSEREDVLPPVDQHQTLASSLEQKGQAHMQKGQPHEPKGRKRTTADPTVVHTLASLDMPALASEDDQVLQATGLPRIGSRIKHGENPKRNRWSLTALASYMTQASDGYDEKTTQLSPSTAHARDLQNQNTRGASLSLLTTYRINRLLSVSSGLSYMHLIDRYRVPVAYEYAIEGSSGQTRFYYSDELLSFMGPGNVLTDQDISIIGGLEQDIRTDIWRIPFILHAGWQQKRLTMGLFGGAALQIAKSRPSTILATAIPWSSDSNVFEQRSDEADHSNSMSGINWLAGVEIGYRLSDRLRLQAGYQAQSIDLLSTYDQKRLLAHGPQMGLSVIL